MATPEREEQGVLAEKTLELDEEVTQAQKNLAQVEKTHKISEVAHDLDGSWEVPGY